MKIYIVKDEFLVEFFTDDDLEGFTTYSQSDWEDPYIEREVYEFASVEEKNAFINGYCHGLDDRVPSGFIILHDDCESDLPYIQAFINPFNDTYRNGI